MVTYIIIVILALFLAFICGAIPVALIVGRARGGVDVREHGSGNAGSTNAARVLGLGPGLLVFAGDVFKGALGCVVVVLAVGITITFVSIEATQQALMMSLESEVFEFDPIVSILASDQTSYLYEIPTALSIIVVVLGHMFSPFMSFKGGKGVATTLGAVLVVMPLSAVCALVVFAAIAFSTRYVSLSSIVAVITVPIFTFIFYDSSVYLVFTIFLAAVVVWAHRKNISRLAKREEPKFSLSKKKATPQEDNDIDPHTGAKRVHGLDAERRADNAEEKIDDTEATANRASSTPTANKDFTGEAQ